MKINQYFRCFIGYPLTAIFLNVLSIISLIAPFLFRIALACSSWSMYIYNSSINSLFTCSYSDINANNLSIYPFNCLFLSKPMKCSFLNFSSSVMIASSSAYCALMLALTPFNWLLSSFPLATSLAKLFE